MSKMHPKDREVLTQLFGSGSLAVLDRTLDAARTPRGQQVTTAAKAVGVAAALALVIGSIDFRS